MPTMPNSPQQCGGGTAIQRMFGAQAPVYAESKVHIRDDSLDAVQRLTEGAAPYRWAVDVETGAGFTAFAMAQVSDRAVASDLTRPMLQQARRLGRERGLANLGDHPERRRVAALRRRFPGPGHMPRRRPPFPRLQIGARRSATGPEGRGFPGDGRQRLAGGRRYCPLDERR